MIVNLALDESLIKKPIKNHRTRKNVVAKALHQYIHHKKQTEILKIFHTVDFSKDYDYKQQRTVK